MPLSQKNTQPDDKAPKPLFNIGGNSVNPTVIFISAYDAVARKDPKALDELNKTFDQLLQQEGADSLSDNINVLLNFIERYQEKYAAEVDLQAALASLKNTIEYHTSNSLVENLIKYHITTEAQTGNPPTESESADEESTEKFEA